MLKSLFLLKMLHFLEVKLAQTEIFKNISPWSNERDCTTNHLHVDDKVHMI